MERQEQWERRLGVAVGIAMIAMDRISPAIVTLMLILGWLAVLAFTAMISVVLPPFMLVSLVWLYWGGCALSDRLDSPTRSR